MAFAQPQLTDRPIRGAVATVGVSDRVAFLRRTYAHLGIALIAWAALTAGILRYMPDTVERFSVWALNGRWNWFLVILAFAGIGWLAQRLALSDTSRGVQYAGLALGVVGEAVILQPLLWVVIKRFGVEELQMNGLIGQAAGITLAIFIGLTLTVFVTKKDFSFLRGALTIGIFAVLGVIVASMIFGFQLGALFCGAVILLMAGYILYQTSLVMAYFPPTHHVAAALMLFSTIATLFWYVLQLLMSLRRD